MTPLQGIVISGDEDRRVPPINIDTAPKGSLQYDTVLIDITKDKKWVAYVTISYDSTDPIQGVDSSKKNNLRAFLTVRNFTETHQLIGTNIFLSIDITDYFNFQNKSIVYRFLSVSSNGKAVALSFYTGEGGAKHRLHYGCLIFEVTNDNILLKRPTIQHQGRAAFTDTYLVVANDSYIVTLNEEYKDLHYVQLPEHWDCGTIYAQYFLATWIYVANPWFKPFEQPLLSHYFLFLQHSYVILLKDEKYCLWSIENNCIVLTISKKERFVSLLPDQKWCITYSNNSKTFRLIDLTTKSTINWFRYQGTQEPEEYIGHPSVEHLLRDSFRLFVNDAQVTNNGKHLVISGICKNMGGDIYIWTEVWHIESGLSIDWTFEINDGAYYPESCRHTIWPFTLEMNIHLPYGASKNDVHYYNNTLRQCTLGNTTDQDESCITGHDKGSKQHSRGTTASLKIGQLSDISSVNIIDNSLKIPTLQESPKPVRGLTVLYSNYNKMKSIQLDIFQNTNKHNMHSSKGTSANSGWKKFKGQTNFHSYFAERCVYHKSFEFKSYWALYDQHRLRLWSFPIDSAVVLPRVPDYPDWYDNAHYTLFEEKISNHGQLVYSYAFSKYNKTTENRFFIAKEGRYERLVVELLSESDGCYFFEDCILPIGLKDKDAPKYFGYNLKNACKTVSINSEVTRLLLFDMLEKMKTHPTNYFATVLGCRTLELLASWEDIHDVLYHLLKNDQLPIMIRTYDAETTKENFVSDYNNLLIQFIHQKKIDLFNLLFNRLLLSRSSEVACLSVITETLMYLQEQGQREILLSTCKKLSFLDIDGAKLPTALYSPKNLTNIQNLYTFSSQEQLQYYHSSNYVSSGTRSLIKDQLYSYFKSFRYSTVDKNYSDIFIIRSIQQIVAYFQDDYKKYKQPIQERFLKICIVPLIHFNSYYINPIDKQLTSKSMETGKPLKESLFVQTATKIDDNNIFNEGDLVFEIMLEHKWKQFAKWRFLGVCFVHIMFYVSYTVGISFATKVFDYIPGSQISHGGQIACLCLMFIAELILLIQEIRQAFKAYSKIYYFRSPYNWIDWASLILPIIMLVFLRQNNSAFNVLNSFTALILWLQGVIRVRVFRTIGVTLETIIQLVLEVKGILLVFLLIVCAFTNAFIVLLMDKEDEYFQEKFSGSVTPSGETNSGLYDTNSSDTSASNPFKDVFKSFSTLWFFIFGVWDPITDGDAGDNRAIVVLGILFSLLTILIFFNLVIVYMSGKIEEIRKKGKKAWTRHYASVVAEIEQLWCLPGEKVDRNMHPSYIYYYAHINDVDRQARAIEDETQEIIKRLDKVYGADIPRNNSEKDKPLRKEDVIEIMRSFISEKDNLDRKTNNNQATEDNSTVEKSHDESIDCNHSQAALENLQKFSEWPLTDTSTQEEEVVQKTKRAIQKKTNVSN